MLSLWREDEDAARARGEEIPGAVEEVPMDGTMDSAGLKVAKKINSFGGSDEKPTKKVYVYSVDITESDATTATTAAS